MKSLESYSCNEWVDAARPYCEICEGRETSFEIEPPRVEYLKEVEEVYLDGLRARDYLIIHTENSVYRFTIIDPEKRFGLLTGGSLGYHRIKATLEATIPTDPPERIGRVMTIREHTRIVFSIPSEKTTERLVTSLVTKLTQVAGGLSTVTMPIA